MDLLGGGRHHKLDRMKSYYQYCPVARASEIIAERWTPIIIRNLLMGCRTFSEILEGAPGLSKTLLTQRLRALERHGIVERRPNPSGRGHTYHPTRAGEDLGMVCGAMGMWAARWLEVTEDHRHPFLVLWGMSRTIAEKDLPARRVVIRFDFSDREAPRRLWVVLEPGHREVCLKDPGYEEDLVFTTDRSSLVDWHMGWLPIRSAMREGRIVLKGSPRLVREFISRWQGLDPAAGTRPEWSASTG